METASQSGFTLIDVVVIVAIFALLAAFAVPRFASLEVETRQAATEALGGRVRSGAALAHALYLVEGTHPASVSLDGKSIAIANGYPSTGGIEDALSEDAGFDHAAGSGVWTHAEAAHPEACSVKYVQPLVRGASPSITVDTTGC